MWSYPGKGVPFKTFDAKVQVRNLKSKLYFLLGSFTYYEMDTEKVVVYEFDAKTFSLLQMRSEDSSSIVWLNEEKTLFKDNLNQEMKITYGTLGYIEQIKLLKGNAAVKTIK